MSRMLGKDNDPVEQRLSPANQRELEREMTTLLNELTEMAQAIYEQLEARTAKLESLIRAADERIERLAQAEGAPATAADGGEGSADAIDPRHAEVYQLADEGLSASRIAERLGRPCGEIELILALRE